MDVDGPDGDALRALVREVLSELLPAEMEAGACVVGTPNAVTHPAPCLRACGARRGYPRAPLWGIREWSAGRGWGRGLAHSVRENVEAVETVSLRNDADLDAFVKRLLRLFENPKQRDALRAGRLRFRLAAASGPGSVQPAHRVDKGAVTEAMVRQAARAGARLVLGRRAVLTPLARDRARAAGVEIERER